MAILTVSYTRQFLSETDHYDDSYHGSPNWIPFQGISDQDKGLREKAIKLFSHSITSDTSQPHYRRDSGFDGSQFYEFSFSGEPMTKRDDKEERVNYLAKVNIKKAGNGERLKAPCDLELFLIQNDFEKSES